MESDSSTQVVSIERFSLPESILGKILVINGKRRTGKSFLIYDLIKFYKSQYKEICVFTNIRGEYTNYDTICTSFSEVYYRVNINKKDNYLIIFDDYDNKQIVQYVSDLGELNNWTIIIGTTWMYEFPVWMVPDYIFYGYEDVATNKRKLLAKIDKYNEYIDLLSLKDKNIFPHFDINIIDQVPNNFSFLVIQRNGGLKWYKADIQDKFEMVNMISNPSIIVIGDDNTNFILNFYKQFQDNFEQVYVFTKNNKYPDLFKSFDLQNPDNKNLLCDLYKDEDRPNRLLIFENDCYFAELQKNKDFIDIVYNGKHCNISYIVSKTEPRGFPPEIRVNFDYVFLGNQRILSNIKSLYDQYSFCANYQRFKNNITNLSQNEYIVNNNRMKNSDNTSNLFYIAEQVNREELRQIHTIYFSKDNTGTESKFIDKSIIFEELDTLIKHVQNIKEKIERL